MRSSSSPAMVVGSRVVEEGIVQTGQRALSFRFGPFDRFGRQVVDQIGRADPLREVAAAVVHLQEVATAVRPPWRAGRDARRPTTNSATSPASASITTGARPS